MSKMELTEIRTSNCEARLKIRRGHFASNHAHINYYIDVTALRTRNKEAREVARSLADAYIYGTEVDTILCVEGTEIIAAFLSEELTKSGFLSANARKSISIVRPEFNTNSQLIFRGNLIPSIAGKNVMVLISTITTGKSLNRALECVQYYQGAIAGISAIFSALEEYNGVPISAAFSQKDIPDYQSWDYRKCPLCEKGEKLDALVNAYGYENLG